MISIIICSRNDAIPAEVRQSIIENIGCEFELVVIDNSENKYSIFEAYNKGVALSKGEVLCFVHEDVLFRSEGWGSEIEKYFADEKEVGLIGFAGTHFLPNAPMYWYNLPFVSQHNLNNDNGVVKEHFHEEWFGDNNVIEVVAVDGFCFFVRKVLFDKISFDAQTYKGFHLYDMDICMQVIETGYKVCVSRDILIEHRWSEKKQFSKQGADLFSYNLELFARKWKRSLPIHKGLQLPASVYKRTNVLCKQACEGKRVRESNEYRLGFVVLHPFDWIKKKSNKKK